ncbi:hypothetical protein [Microbacterium suwonense]|uniref:hypothetical protein n=1 Tax=Microbacterium suwonense TaxID=683047 RepID=UPI0033058CCB
MVIRSRSCGAPAVGCHASRSHPRRVRVPVFCTAMLVATGSPSRARAGTLRVMTTARELAASVTSSATRIAHSSSQPPKTAHAG